MSTFLPTPKSTTAYKQLSLRTEDQQNRSCTTKDIKEATCVQVGEVET